MTLMATHDNKVKNDKRLRPMLTLTEAKMHPKPKSRVKKIKMPVIDLVAEEEYHRSNLKAAREL